MYGYLSDYAKHIYPEVYEIGDTTVRLGNSFKAYCRRFRHFESNASGKE